MYNLLTRIRKITLFSVSAGFLNKGHGLKFSSESSQLIEISNGEKAKICFAYLSG